MMTYHLAVLGHPVAQSRSPEIHALFAKQAGLLVDYAKIDPGVDGFVAAVQAFKVQGGHGFNVTMPFKQQAYQYVHALSSRAAVAGAVNTVKIDEDGRMFGDNTDGDGLIYALRQHRKFTLTGKTVLILGAGGAVQGILLALLAEQPKAIYIMNRTQTKAEQLAKAVAQVSTRQAIAVPLDAVLPDAIDLLVNAVAFNHLILPNQLSFAPKALAYDLSYGAATKPFTDWALSQGATVSCDGFSMLVCQAALSFALWTGFVPEVAPVLAALQ